jgi:hypothetical protein
MQMDQFPVLGHQMTHSIDSFITDSANSASALYSGHKSTVNAMGVYADSSPDAFDDPKIETIVELLVRYWVCYSSLSLSTRENMVANTNAGLGRALPGEQYLRPSSPTLLPLPLQLTLEAVPCTDP